MTYCGSCGEPVEGRFCRMCGAAVPNGPAATMFPGAVGSAALQAEPTQMLPGAMAGAMTQTLGPQPEPIPASDFDSLFRQPDGAVTPHSQTRLLPPVNADYRMPPPGAAPDGQPQRGAFGHGAVDPASGYPVGDYPPGAGGPGGEDDWYGEPGRGRKPIVWGTVGAVVAAAAVILGLLYVGNHNNSASANTAPPSASANSIAGTPTPSVGDINLPAAGQTSSSPSASASASQSATGNTNLPLTLGSSGRYVTYVQERLHQLKFYQGPINGQYDQATAQAVVDFQGAAHVTGDPAATVDRPTLTALIAAGTRPNLRPGSNDGGDIKRLQQALDSAENAGLAVNGRYDAATVAAMVRYQSAVGVPSTGMANGPTWAALQSGSVI